MQYHDITIEATESVADEASRIARHRVRVLQSPAGEMAPEEAIVVECDDRELQRWLKKLEQRVLDRVGLIALGRTLAALLLPSADAGSAPGVREILERSLLVIPAGDGLRLRLRLPMGLSAIPWEYMYVERGGEGMDGFVALDPRLAIVRHDAAAATIPSAALEGDLKVVVALAAADELPALDLDAELGYITSAVEELNGINIFPCHHATLARLQPLLPNASIFHFAGHGVFEKKLGARPGTYSGTGLLAFEDARVDAEQLGINLRSNSVRLVLLAGCETGRRDGVSVWSGIAPALIKAGIPAVIGNQYTIADTAAVAFSRRFYEAIAGGLPIERAISAARIAIYNQDTSTRDWGVPVLYMRATDGNLFGGVADPRERARALAAAQVDITVRVGNVGKTGIVYGARVPELLDEKVAVSVTARDVSGSVIGLKSGQIKGSVRVDLNAGNVDGIVIGLDATSLGNRPRTSAKPEDPSARPQADRSEDHDT